MADVIVVGAGASGLACAHALARDGVDVVCLEAAPHVGGVIRTTREDDWLFEDGPNTIQASARTFRELCGELGIADRLRLSSTAASKRWVYLRGKLRALPSGPKALFSGEVLSLRARCRVLSEPLRRFRPPPEGSPEPTLGDFLESRLGAEAARNLGGAFVRGVYAAELDELGARSAFPKLWQYCVEHGGLVRGAIKAAKARKQLPAAPGPVAQRGQLLSFDDGLQTLVDSIAASLGERLRTNARVESIARRAQADAQRYEVRLESGEALSATSIVLAIPAGPTHALLTRSWAELGLDTASASANHEGDAGGSLAARDALVTLARVEHAELVIVHLGLSEASIPEGFGFLVSPGEAERTEAPKLLGALFGSRIFEGRAPSGSATVTCIYRAADLEGLADDACAEQALRDLSSALEQSPGEVALHRVRRWKGVIPRYGIGHADRMQHLQAQVAKAVPGLVLCGNYIDGVSVEDRLEAGRNRAKQLSG